MPDFVKSIHVLRTADLLGNVSTFLNCDCGCREFWSLTFFKPLFERILLKWDFKALYDAVDRNLKQPTHVQLLKDLLGRVPSWLVTYSRRGYYSKKIKQLLDINLPLMFRLFARCPYVLTSGLVLSTTFWDLSSWIFIMDGMLLIPVVL